MSKSTPATGAAFSSRLRQFLVSLVWLVVAFGGAAANAQDEPSRRLESIDVQSLPGQRLELRLHMSSAAPQPMSFTIDEPARIALDLPDTALALPARRQDVNLGPVTTILAAEANGRTRVVFNLNGLAPYTTRVVGDTVILEIGGNVDAGPSFAAQPSSGQGAAAGAAGAAASRAGRGIDNIDFRRGADGAGQVIVDLTDPRTTVDVRQEGGRVVVEFQDTELPQELMRRLDVADFATPVATVDALRADGDARLIITPSGDFEEVAYQSENVFTLELKTPAQSEQLPGPFDSDREYTGERLTLNFQDIDTRAVLQLLADTSGLNIVVSDTVQGNVTLRLQNVPWDQALDILITTKGLDMRRNGNVIIVAPAEEIAAREQAQLQAQAALQGLEQLHSEFIQINYAKASDIANLLNTGDSNTMISDRGSVSIDERTNTLLVHDTADRLAEIRRLVATLDIPVRQVLIESRIVIVNDDYKREVGVRLGATAVNDRGNNGLVSMTGNSSGSETIVQSALDNLQSSGTPFPVTTPAIGNRYNVNLPVASPAGSIAVALLDSDYLIDLELSALQAEGNGRIVSTPRVITANQREARISQGVEIPYQEAASSGATTTQFKEAVMSLTVVPQITPDDKIIMDLTVDKDNVGEVVPSATGGFVPSIDTRSVVTQVLVDDGQTVVLGGIYETENRDTVSKVPMLGNIPGLGFLFRTRSHVDSNAELLIFVTPRILREGALVN